MTFSWREKSKNVVMWYLYSNGGSGSIRGLMDSKIITDSELSWAVHELIHENKIETTHSSPLTFYLRMVEDV